jgi:nitric oxide reductase subunit B
MYCSRAPIPEAVVDESGAVLFTLRISQQGQELFRKRNLMNYGSVLGHGAYLQSRLHSRSAPLDDAGDAGPPHRRPLRGARAGIESRRRCGHSSGTPAQPRYDSSRRTLTFTASQKAGWHAIVDNYYGVFVEGKEVRPFPKSALLPVSEGATDGDRREAVKDLSAFVTWTAWLSVAKRPEADHSFTNNWPYDKAAGNSVTAGSMMWSAASVAGLLFFLALILYFQHRYQLTPADVDNPSFRFDIPRMSLTPSQKATAKFFVIAILLFSCKRC